MYVNQFGQHVYSEEDLLQLLYKNPNLDLSLLMTESSKYNDSIDEMYSDLPKSIPSNSVPTDISAEDFHKAQQSSWFMPNKYKEMDIAKYILDLCKTDAELQRVGNELLLYQEAELFDLLRFMKYLVDTCTEHGVVLGVGRGSSVASYVLYLLGAHQVNSMFYDLDFAEFLR